jgi:hypothetical protein
MNRDHLVGFMFGLSVGFMTAYLLQAPQEASAPGDGDARRDAQAKEIFAPPGKIRTAQFGQ